jgi:hypothetical protein
MIAALPDGWKAWARSRKGGKNIPATAPSLILTNLGQRPSWLSRGSISHKIEEQETRAELPEFLAALKLLDPSCGYDQWFEIGASIHDFDPGPLGLAIFEAWSKTSNRNNHQQDVLNGKCAEKWLEYAKPKPGKRLRTKASIYDAALQALPSGGMNGTHALPLALVGAAAPNAGSPGDAGQGFIRFPDVDPKGQKKQTCRNARVAINGLGIVCEHDTFHNKMLVGGHPIAQWAGELSDEATQMLRVVIGRQFRFDPGLVNCHDAAVQECLQNAFDPVAVYLDSLAWDRRSRVATWLSAYLGAEDTRLNRAIGALTLMAAVRRVRQPGCKFDQIIVLESPEGRGKSSAIEILAGEENFSDQTILTLDDKGQQEAVQGVWLYEIADLSGMPKSDNEKVKAFASRRFDRARPAYGRARVDRPRRCIFFATTNDETYLKSQTGNRRFWPVRTGRINLGALARDRDQLWAEASVMEATGHPLGLPESFWGEARAAQDSRLEQDPWEMTLANLRLDKTYQTLMGGQEWRVPTAALLNGFLQIPADRQTMVTVKRLAFTMRRLGWDGPKVFKIDGLAHRGYTREAVTVTKPHTGNP